MCGPNPLLRLCVRGGRGSAPSGAVGHVLGGAGFGDDNEDVSGQQGGAGVGEQDAGACACLFAAQGDDGDAKAPGEFKLNQGATDHGGGDAKLGDDQAIPQGHLFEDSVVNQARGEPLAERALGVDDGVSADEAQDAVHEVVGAAGDDVARPHLAQQGRDDDRRFAGFVADGADTKIAALRGESGEGGFVGGVDADGLGDKGAGRLDAVLGLVNGQDIAASAGERAGEGHTELTEADDEGLFGHKEAPWVGGRCRRGASRPRCPARAGAGDPRTAGAR